MAYNHEKFIEEAINGVMKQKTNFNFELIIANDFSTDNTSKVINSFNNKNKKLEIKHIDRKANLGPNPNFIDAHKIVKGKYVAICEGDDYWTDPNKLQTQVDFLDAHPDFVLCCHNAKIIDTEGNLIQEKKLPDLNTDKDYSSFDLKMGSFLLTLTLVFRNKIKKFPNEFSQVLNGDTFLISLLGKYGKGKYIENIDPAAYRSHTGGVWSGFDREQRMLKKQQFLSSLIAYYSDDEKLKANLKKEQKKIHKRILKSYLSEPSFKKQLVYNKNFFQFYRPSSLNDFKILLKNNHSFFRENLKKH
jgi:glycosyltransferase involved in cell wall biosynthesis